MNFILKRLHLKAISIYVSIVLFSTLFYAVILYQSSPISLHDSAHYAVAGVAMVRDHKDLIYPYGNLQSFTYGANYEALQNNTEKFDSRIPYPNQLFSLIYGVTYLVTGQMKIWYYHIISLLIFISANCLSYASSKRFLSTADSISALLLICSNMLVINCLTLGSTDLASYLCIMICFWYCTREKPHIAVVGLLVGFSILMRTQNISFLVFLPLFFTKNLNIKNYLTSVSKIAILSISIVYLFGKISSLLIDRRINSGGASVDFYIAYFKEATYKPSEIYLFVYELFRDIARIADGQALYILGVMLVLTLLNSKLKNTLSQKLAISSSAIILIPILLYAVERFFPVVSRYYITAVPLIAYATILFINSLDIGITTIPKLYIKIVVIIISLSNYLSYADILQTKNFSIARMESIAKFLDFENAAETLKHNFTKDSIVLSNHSYITGLSTIDKIVYTPKFESFIEGNNERIDGIVLTYTERPEAFQPTDWLNSDKSPRSEITDKNGTKFRLLYERKNTTWNNYTARMLIYTK